MVGEVVELGEGVEGYAAGQRVLVTADTPCGQCEECLGSSDGRGCQAGGSVAGFHLDVLRDGAQAEYVAVPYAQATMAPVPHAVSDEQALMMACVGTTGVGAVEASGLRMGDTVAVVGQGPVGLAATAAAGSRGAGLVIAIDVLPWRLQVARWLGADVVVDAARDDAVAQVRCLTGGRMADVAVEAVGTQETFAMALRLTRPAGVLSSVGNYGMEGSLTLPLDRDAFMGGIGEKRILTTAAPGGRDRGRRLLQLVASGRVDLSCLVTHRYRLDEIEAAYDGFRTRREPVLKVVVTVGG